VKRTLFAMQNIIAGDITVAVRRRTDILMILLFFIIVTSLFPLSVTPETETLRGIAPGIIWVAALLASMLSLNRLFSDDHQDGSLEQMVLSSLSLPAQAAGKVVAHWLISCVPLIMVSPLIGVQYDLPHHAMLVMMASLLLGTPLLSVIGAIGAALAVGLRSSSALIALLVLPLYVPVLILGSGAVEASMAGLGAQAHLSLLGALLIIGFTFAPWVIAMALRTSLE
jgi:heme exporter protein B